MLMVSDQLCLYGGVLVACEVTRLSCYLSRCVLETMRLHAPGMITRKVTSTHKIGVRGGRERWSKRGRGRECLCYPPFQGYDVPAGHYLMLSPYWAHRDREKFPDPETFNPVRNPHSPSLYSYVPLSLYLSLQDRWLECDLEKNQFLDGFVGFGGGRYQCPGR